MLPVVDSPARPARPLVIAVPHAGTRLVPGMEPLLDAPPRRLRALEDPWVDRLVADAPAAGAWRIVQPWARAVADVNRAPDEFCGLALETGFRATAKAKVGLGVVPTAIGGQPLYRRGLTRDELEARLALAHRPYHRRLERLLDTVRSRFGRVLLLDWHSMPDAALGSRCAAVDVVLGDHHGRAAQAATTAALEAAFRRQGLSVARNRPYAGGYVTQTYGRPDDSCEAVQVEVRRGLYMDERRFTPSPRFDALRAALEAVLRDMAAHLDERGGLPLALAGA